MPTLSQYVKNHPQSINEPLTKLTAVNAGITHIDIDFSLLELYTKNASPTVQRGVRKEIERRKKELSKRKIADLARSQAQKGRQKKETFAASYDSTASSTNLRDPAHAVRKGNSYGECFSFQVAARLRTVLLSQNLCTSINGVIQFCNVTRLSLRNNALKRIEDCEPLGVLPKLQYLAMRGNPVVSLPNFVFHVLRICSWPYSLSETACRLKKLDELPITRAEVKLAVGALHQEEVFFPLIAQRMELFRIATAAWNRFMVEEALLSRRFLSSATDEPYAFVSSPASSCPSSSPKGQRQFSDIFFFALQKKCITPIIWCKPEAELPKIKEYQEYMWHNVREYITQHFSSSPAFFSVSASHQMNDCSEELNENHSSQKHLSPSFHDLHKCALYQEVISLLEDKLIQLIYRSSEEYLTSADRKDEKLHSIKGILWESWGQLIGCEKDEYDEKGEGDKEGEKHPPFSSFLVQKCMHDTKSSNSLCKSCIPIPSCSYLSCGSSVLSFPLSSSPIDDVSNKVNKGEIHVGGAPFRPGGKPMPGVFPNPFLGIGNASCSATPVLGSSVNTPSVLSLSPNCDLPSIRCGVDDLPPCMTDITRDGMRHDKLMLHEHVSQHSKDTQFPSYSSSFQTPVDRAPFSASFSISSASLSSISSNNRRYIHSAIKRREHSDSQWRANRNVLDTLSSPLAPALQSVRVNEPHLSSIPFSQEFSSSATAITPLPPREATPVGSVGNGPARPSERSWGAFHHDANDSDNDTEANQKGGTSVVVSSLSFQELSISTLSSDSSQSALGEVALSSIPTTTEKNLEKKHEEGFPMPSQDASDVYHQGQNSSEKRKEQQLVEDMVASLTTFPSRILFPPILSSDSNAQERAMLDEDEIVQQRKPEKEAIQEKEGVGMLEKKEESLTVSMEESTTELESISEKGKRLLPLSFLSLRSIRSAPHKHCDKVQKVEQWKWEKACLQCCLDRWRLRCTQRRMKYKYSRSCSPHSQRSASKADGRAIPLLSPFVAQSCSSSENPAPLHNSSSYSDTQTPLVVRAPSSNVGERKDPKEKRSSSSHSTTEAVLVSSLPRMIATVDRSPLPPPNPANPPCSTHDSNSAFTCEISHRKKRLFFRRYHQLVSKRRARQFVLHRVRTRLRQAVSSPVQARETLSHHDPLPRPCSNVKGGGKNWEVSDHEYENFEEQKRSNFPDDLVTSPALKRSNSSYSPCPRRPPSFPMPPSSTSVPSFLQPSPPQLSSVPSSFFSPLRKEPVSSSRIKAIFDDIGANKPSAPQTHPYNIIPFKNPHDDVLHKRKEGGEETQTSTNAKGEGEGRDSVSVRHQEEDKIRGQVGRHYCDILHSQLGHTYHEVQVDPQETVHTEGMSTSSPSSLRRSAPQFAFTSVPSSVFSSFTPYSFDPTRWNYSNARSCPFAFSPATPSTNVVPPPVSSSSTPLVSSSSPRRNITSSSFSHSGENRRPFFLLPSRFPSEASSFSYVPSLTSYHLNANKATTRASSLSPFFFADMYNVKESTEPLTNSLAKSLEGEKTGKENGPNRSIKNNANNTGNTLANPAVEDALMDTKSFELSAEEENSALPFPLLAQHGACKPLSTSVEGNVRSFYQREGSPQCYSPAPLSSAQLEAWQSAALQDCRARGIGGRESESKKGKIGGNEVQWKETCSTSRNGQDVRGKDNHRHPSNDINDDNCFSAVSENPSEGSANTGFKEVSERDIGKINGEKSSEVSQKQVIKEQGKEGVGTRNGFVYLSLSDEGESNASGKSDLLFTAKKERAKTLHPFPLGGEDTFLKHTEARREAELVGSEVIGNFSSHSCPIFPDKRRGKRNGKDSINVGKKHKKLYCSPSSSSFPSANSSFSSSFSLSSCAPPKKKHMLSEDVRLHGVISAGGKEENRKEYSPPTKVTHQDPMLFIPLSKPARLREKTKSTMLHQKKKERGEESACVSCLSSSITLSDYSSGFVGEKKNDSITFSRCDMSVENPKGFSSPREQRSSDLRSLSALSDTSLASSHKNLSRNSCRRSCQAAKKKMKEVAFLKKVIAELRSGKEECNRAERNNKKF